MLDELINGASAGSDALNEDLSAGEPADIATSEDALTELLPETPSEDSSEASVGEDGREQEASDWEKRCLAAEAALEDSLEFAGLYAAEGGELDAASLRESEVYRRFCELRSMGLSVKEAFFAADSAREKKGGEGGKEHLLSAPATRRPSGSRMSGAELALAKRILGDGYTNEELLRLYRRVAKS